MYNFLTVTHRRLDIFRIFKKTNKTMKLLAVILSIVMTSLLIGLATHVKIHPYWLVYGGYFIGIFYCTIYDKK